ncbi:MAG TPA: MgtC/SapB family protein [Candidatus Wirthbacteria bacterium]|nr:MgtC/SapB family protein [Candidatus Wirthbacteria bacterium]
MHPVSNQAVYLLQILLSALLGAVIGIEREKVKKPAGIRTYILVSIGACLFTIISHSLVNIYEPGLVDPTRIAAQILSGIGFIGAGVIMKKGDHVEGITTAAGLWATSAIGVAVGFELYTLAIGSTLIVWFILSSMHIFNKYNK